MAYIEATTPTVTPATAEKTFPYWWISSLTVNASDAPVANMAASLRKFRVLEDGSMEFSSDAPVSLYLNDLLGTAGEDAELAAMLTALYAKIQAVGVAQGVL